METAMRSKEENEFIDSFEQFFKLDKTTEELKLFVSRACIDKRKPVRRWLAGWFVEDGMQVWLDRLRDWKFHLDQYDKIVELSERKPAKPEDTLEKIPAAAKSEETDEKTTAAAKSEVRRLTHLHSFLSILDSKIGMSLSFNSLLLGAVGVFLTWVPGLLEKTPSPYGKWAFLLVFRGITVVALGILLMSLWVLLLGFRRVVWGDLTKTTAENLVDKAREYSRFLIISLTRRTNTFRISTYLTKIALVILGMLIVMAMIVSLLAPSWDLEHGKDESGKGSVFIQVDSNNQEIGGGSGNDMRNEVKHPAKVAPPNAGGGKISPPTRNCDCKTPEPPMEK
jgi:hypothetical protein